MSNTYVYTSVNICMNILCEIYLNLFWTDSRSCTSASFGQIWRMWTKIFTDISAGMVLARVNLIWKLATDFYYWPLKEHLFSLASDLAGEIRLPQLSGGDLQGERRIELSRGDGLPIIVICNMSTIMNQLY